MLRSILPALTLKNSRKKNTLQVIFLLCTWLVSLPCIYSTLVLPLMLLTSTAKKKTLHYINTSEMPDELSHVSLISSHVKITSYFTSENNMYLSQVLRLPLLFCCMIETSPVPPRKSSVIFGYLQFWKLFGKWSEIFGKSSKTSLLVCLYNKQNITCPLVKIHIHAREYNTLYFLRTIRGYSRSF